MPDPQKPQTAPRAGDPAPQGEEGSRVERLKQNVRERTRTFVRRLKFAAWLTVAAAVGYGVAALRGHLALQDWKQVSADRQAKLEAGVADTKRFARALQARRTTHRALLALDQRNFGQSETFAHEAGALVADPELAGAQYGEISESLASFRPLVSDDVQQQRAELLALIAQFDALLDAQKAPDELRGGTSKK